MTDTIISDNTTGLYIGDFAGTDDVNLIDTTPTTNYGSSSLLEITTWSLSDRKHGLLRFTGVSNISASEIVSAVTVGIYRYSSSTGTQQTLTFRRLLRVWVEAQATWNIWSTGNNWTTAGALSDGNDRSATVSVSKVTTNTINEYKTFSDTDNAQLKTDFQNFIDGTYVNDGHFINVTNPASGTYGLYRASEAADGQRPYLLVTHAAVGGRVMGGLAGLGGLAGYGGLAGIGGGLAG